MGYDLNRFEGAVDEELVCLICSGVLEDATWSPNCEHAFCAACIQEWLRNHLSCPVDRSSLNISQLKPAPRLMRSLLNRLQIHCDNSIHGCDVVIKLEFLPRHLATCEHNPLRLVTCKSGCGIDIPFNQLPEHNCIRHLRVALDLERDRVSALCSEIENIKSVVKRLEYKSKCKHCHNSNIPVSSDTSSQIHSNSSNMNGSSWIENFSFARVNGWGGLISTPDTTLQTLVTRSLTETNCPCVTELTQKAHERHWPPGLSTLETRQENRSHYQNYVCRRIPGKQAVIVMKCENRHMPDNMITEPGLVMIFAHGIE